MAKNWDVITINLAADAQIEKMRAILDYESDARGVSYGQAFAQLVMNAIDTNSYPPEVQERLAELREERQARAVEKSLAVAS